MIYEDKYGDIIDTEQLYKCFKCGWIGTVSEMDFDSDCDDEYDAIFSDYCCPKCWTFYSFITYWEKV